MLTREQTEFFLVKAYNAALRAGARILDIYNDGVDIEVNLKSDRTPITLADCESHTLIKSYLGPTHIPLLSEEGRDLLYEERRNWDLFWMVDPLDGTKEFIKGNGEFTVNIALMYNNRPEIGVIYVPYIHKMYFAIRGVGSFRKTEVLPDPESEKSLAEILEGREPLPLVEAANEPIRIAVSRSHNTDETFEHISRIKQRYPSAVVIQQGSSYKFCLLAEASSMFMSVRLLPANGILPQARSSCSNRAAGSRILRAAGSIITKRPSEIPILSARTAFGGIDPGLLRFAGTDLRKDSRRTDLSAGTTSAGGLRRRGTSCLLRSLNTGEFHNKVN